MQAKTTSAVYLSVLGGQGPSHQDYGTSSLGVGRLGAWQPLPDCLVARGHPDAAGSCLYYIYILYTPPKPNGSVFRDCSQGSQHLALR